MSIDICNCIDDDHGMMSHSNDLIITGNLTGSGS